MQPIPYIAPECVARTGQTWRARQRRCAAAAAQLPAAKRCTQQLGVQLEFVNHGRQWVLRWDHGVPMRLDWWPASGRLLVNHAYDEAIAATTWEGVANILAAAVSLSGG